MNAFRVSRAHCVILFVIFLGSLLGFTQLGFQRGIMTVQSQPNLREGWAVLLEMNDYPDPITDLPTDFSDSRKWNATLQSLGWQTHHIQFYHGFLDQHVGEAALQFLARNADANDIVLFYIFAHGSWIRDHMQWYSWFPTQWAELQSLEKLLVVSACSSEELIEPLTIDPAPHIHIAAAQKDEGYAWAGLPEEGLPIIGEVFNHFFTNALVNTSADQDSNGEICVEEAFVFASPLSQEYITTVVFPAFPDFADSCNNTAPQPVIDDAYLGNFSLAVELGDPPLIPSTLSPIEIGIILVTIVTFVVVVVLGLSIRQRRRIVQ
ncbi:MAG: hypothetical protein ACFE8O_10110 [Candidatus Hermodarchaeota archaeon]